LLAIEQKMVRPTFGVDRERESKTIAPRDAETGMPILSKSHQLVDNLPANYERRGLDCGRYFKGSLRAFGTELQRKERPSARRAVRPALMLYRSRYLPSSLTLPATQALAWPRVRPHILCQPAALARVQSSVGPCRLAHGDPVVPNGIRYRGLILSSAVDLSSVRQNR
jgi:hypothetical protein